MDSNSSEDDWLLISTPNQEVENSTTIEPQPSETFYTWT